MPLIYPPRFKYTSEVEELSVNNYPALHYRHVYDAEGDDYTESPADILQDPLCIRRGQFDEQDSTAYVDRVRVVRNTTNDARPLFLIHVDTRTDFVETTDPRSDPATIEWYSQGYQGFSTKDREGKTVFNTAGSIFKFAHDDAHWIARISKNVTQTPYDLFQYENALNDSEIQVDGIPAAKETLRCNGIRISPWKQATVNGNRVYYRTCTFLLIHRRNGWKIIKDNVGFEEYKIAWRPKMIEEIFVADSGPRAGRRQIRLVEERTAAGEFVWERRGEREPIILENGQPPFTEQVLDREGKWVRDPRPEDVIIVNESSGGIEYYRPLPFNNLPGINDSPRPRGNTSPFGF